MPSSSHELLVGLFRAVPDLLKAPLARCGVVLPPHDRTVAVDASLGELLPTERRADLLLLYESEAPVFAVILEVQLAVDREKEWRWASYVAAVQDRHRCPVALVVVAPEPAVAAWARGPFRFGFEDRFRPVVVAGPQVPRLDELSASEWTAENILLSMGVHVRTEADLALVDLARSRPPLGMDGNKVLREYWPSILAAVPKRLWAAVEAKMKIDISEAQPFIDRIEAMILEHGRERGREEGRHEGRQEGRHEGRQEGRQEGRLAAARQTFRRQAARRGWTLLPKHETRLDACTNPDQLDVWLDRLITAATVDEALD